MCARLRTGTKDGDWDGGRARTNEGRNHVRDEEGGVVMKRKPTRPRPRYIQITSKAKCEIQKTPLLGANSRMRTRNKNK